MVAVDICNLALSYLGDSATVASIDPPEGSAQAQHCARFYPIARNLLLESHQWNFTTRRASLALVQADYSPEWRFVYAMPSDATDVISVLPRCVYPARYFLDDRMPFGGDPLDVELSTQYDFVIETQSSTREVILSNVEDAVARYCVSTVEPGAFSALFADALAWKLAAMLAGPLLKGDVGAAESKRCLQMAQGVLEEAQGQDANQRRGNPQPMPSWIAARA